jgi:oligopeptide transport system substrate-binding protein
MEEKMNKKFYVIMFAVLAFAMILSACGPAAAPAAEGEEPPAAEDTTEEAEAEAYEGPKVLNMSLGYGDIPTLDPSKAEDTSSIQLALLMFPGVTRANEVTSVVEPAMADSWDVSDDGTVYTFHIKEGVSWVKYDEVMGEVVEVTDEEGAVRYVTADDFYFGFIRTLKAETGSPYAYVLDMTLAGAEDFHYADEADRDETTVGVKVIDAQTLELTFINPGLFNASVAGMWMGYAQPSWVVEELGDRWFEPGNIETYGPYTLKDWIHDYEATLIKNPFWAGTEYSPSPAIDEVNFRFLDPIPALAEYEAGSMDVAAVPSEDMDRVKADDVLSAEYVQSGVFCSYYYGFNTQAPPMDDVRVRKAFSLAIDRAGLIDNVLKGAQTPARWVENPGLAGSPTLETHPDAGIGYDAEAAKAELQAYLDETGQTAADLDITLLHNESSGHALIAETIQAMWKDTLGVEVKIAAQEWKVYLDLIDGPNAPQIFRLGWCLDYPDANNFTHELFALCGNSNACKNGKVYGGIQWYNQEYEDLMDQAAGETDNAARQDLYAAANTILHNDDAAVAPIYWYGRQTLTKPFVTRTFGVGGHEYFDKWDIDMEAKMSQ